jgi:hypothetical protein
MGRLENGSLKGKKFSISFFFNNFHINSSIVPKLKLLSERICQFLEKLKLRDSSMKDMDK